MISLFDYKYMNITGKPQEHHRKTTYQISHIKYHISNITYQISNIIKYQTTL